MQTLVLSPAGHVVPTPALEGDEQVAERTLGDAFKDGDARGILELAARCTDQPWSGAVGYWRDIGKTFLVAALKEDRTRIPPPSGYLAAAVQNAPPMRGGEYLALAVLERLWNDLVAAADAMLSETGADLAAFLAEKSPAWGLVGKVCLSLAENKRSPDRPFAFLATYTTRLTANGRVQHVPFAKAVQDQAGTGERSGLLAILAPLQRAASRCPLLDELLATKRIFQPLAWTAAEALRFLREVPALEDAGILVRVPDWWSSENPPRAKVSVSVGSRAPSQVGLDGLLDFDLHLSLDGETLSEDEWKRLTKSADGLTMIRGRWVEVDGARLKDVVAHWRAAQRAVQEGGLTFAAAMRLLVGAPGAAAADGPASAGTEEKAATWSEVVAGPWLRDALAGLRDPERLGVADPGKALTATLRPYQAAGVKWLWHLYNLRLGGCLADDMGLGKTIQVLALLLLARARKEKAPSLLVVPASLIGNWCAEAARFASSLRLLVVHPTLGRKDAVYGVAPLELATTDLVITSYATATRAAWLAAVDWNLVVLDEAQAIKNPGTRQTRAVKALRSRRRLALTGTPVENRLQDLWSIFDFVNPGLLGSAKQFAAATRADGGESAAKSYGAVRKLVTPYILRRLKTDKSIIDDLPAKTEVKVACSLTPMQAALYERTVVQLREELARSTEGIARRGLVLSYLMRFKQICNHPSQLSGDGVYAPGQSGKLRRLRELVEEIAARGEKVLVFTQFQEICAMLSTFLEGSFGRTGAVLTGATPVKRRQALVSAFQSEGGPPFFVLSLKAGGTGLNLTAASQVVHFDRWWNPAVEAQATDRAFRIGQKRPVMVHKLVAVGTIEERIDEMIEAKQQLAAGILTGADEMDLTALSDEQIMQLVTLDLSRATAANEDE